MPTIGKIIVFIILGLILLILSFLYQKLKDEIADLDEKIMDNLFFFRISASDCNEHDTLFYLKSLDLDRRMGYELGTIYECTHEN